MSGIARPTLATTAAIERAVVEITDITEELLLGLPARRQPPRTVPPLRRPEVRARMGLEPLPG